MNIDTLFSLDGRIALVTGGTGGIGRMIAEGFIAAGATVYVCSRKADAVEGVARALGPNCFGIVEDVSTVAGCRRLSAALAATEDRLDILVNNAGAAWGEPFEEFSEEGWDKVMDLNVRTPFFLTQTLYGMLKVAAGPGRPSKVINIGSVDGQRLNPWETYSYHASKAAILYLTKRLAARLVVDGINVTAIAPGAFPSKMNRAARDRAETVALTIPSERIGTAEDIAAAAIYLASRAGDYVVGETISVDGGVVHATLGVSADG